jgi:hypothetical protein
VGRKNGVSLGGSVNEEPPGKNAGRAVALIPEGLSSETDPAGLKPRELRSHQLSPLIEINEGLRFHLIPYKLLKNSSSNSDHASWGNWNIKLVPSIFVLIILGQAHRAGTTTGPSFFLIKKRPDSIKNRDAAQKLVQIGGEEKDHFDP